MKNKAFTLIELLAVIIILGIIATIATPKLLKVINSAKDESFRISVGRVFSAYEVYELENDFNEIGVKISVLDKKFPIESKFKSGEVFRNENEQIEIENVSDGKYCAGGTKEYLNIVKDSCSKLIGAVVKVNISKIQSNSITVTVEAIDNENGIKGIYYSLDDKNYKNGENVYTFDNLKSNQTYKIYVKVINGNDVETIVEKEVTTTSIGVPTYAVNSTGWTNQDKIVTITYPEELGLTYEYSIDKGSTWLSAAQVQEVTFSSNGSVIARVKSGENIVTGKTFMVDKIDKVIPTISEVSGNNDNWTQNKTLIVTASDEGGSEIKEYSFNDGNDWQVSNSKIIESNGTYNIKVMDNAGNISDTYSIIINKVGSPSDNPSVPELINGMTPIKYNGNDWIVIDSSTDNWYNYSKQEWANAVVLNSDVTKNIGDTVDILREVRGTFVWIPRYEYKIEGQYGTHVDGTEGTAELPGEIKVNFISKDIVEATEGYIIHSAFWWDNNSNSTVEDGEQLSGIWVGKFETSADKTNKCYIYTKPTDDDCKVVDPRVLPNSKSLRNQRVSTQFETAQKFTNYITNGDSHLMKSSEWGAVAYLSQSKFGKYGNSKYVGAEKEVMINNCSNYITGIGADSLNDGESTSTCTTNTYETEKGQAASTTGNITGIYDMNGGSHEYVMGVLADSTGKPRSGYSSSFNSGFTGKLSDNKSYTGKSFPKSKYYNLYTSETSATACNGGICYGQALSETAGWYSDYSFMVSINHSWLTRGGYYGGKATSGIFYSSQYTGDTGGNDSFHIVIINTN